jgi:hypothetical protein
VVCKPGLVVPEMKISVALLTALVRILKRCSLSLKILKHEKSLRFEGWIFLRSSGKKEMSVDNTKKEMSVNNTKKKMSVNNTKKEMSLDNTS